MPFVECTYQVVDPAIPGSKDRKLIGVLKSIPDNQVTVVIARDRSTLLKTLHFGRSKEHLYIQMGNLGAFDDFQLNLVSVSKLAKQIEAMTHSPLDSVLAFITLFRNNIIELPIPTYYYSIPAIIALFRRLSKKNPKIPFILPDYTLNPLFLKILFSSLEILN